MATLLSQTMSAVEWISDASLAALDEAAEAALDRRLAVEDSITFDELIEQMADFTHEQREEFMKALERGNAQDLHLIHCLIDQSREAIVKRRLAGGE